MTLAKRVMFMVDQQNQSFSFRLSEQLRYVLVKRHAKNVFVIARVYKYKLLVIVISSFTCFRHGPLVCLREQSDAGQLSVQRSDVLSPVFTLVSSDIGMLQRSHFPHCICVSGYSALLGRTKSQPCVIASLASTGSRHFVSTSVSTKVICITSLVSPADHPILLVTTVHSKYEGRVLLVRPPKHSTYKHNRYDCTSL